MPTYQYACTACDERLEVVQKFTDDPLNECPTCTGQLRKVFSPVGIVFKGSGFYRTDSRPTARDGGAAAGAKDGSAPAKDGKASTSGGSAADSSGSTANAKADAPAAATKKADTAA